MKQLFLIRHAEADSNNFDIKDIDRPLTANGEIVASKVGKALHDLIGIPDEVLSSVALRTRQTTGLILEQVGLDVSQVLFKDELYEASARILLQQVNSLKDTSEKAVIICHNPAIPYLAEYITGALIGSVSPGGIIQVSFDGNWAEVSQKNAALVQYHVPPMA